MQTALREHLPLLMICLFYMIGQDILSSYVANQHPDFDYYTLSTILLYIIKFYFAASVCIMVFLFVLFINYLILHHSKPFWRNLTTRFKNKFLSVQQFYGFILIFLLIPLFFAYIAMYKQLIPFVNPFSWDTTFMQWDYVLHFHHHPWELLQPIVGHPAITSFLARVYGLWFFVLAGIILWQANTAERFYRMQFFLTFLFSWIILGTIMAYYFSSAGPCFYYLYSHGTHDPYQPLMSYLIIAAPSWVINLQNSLMEHLLDKTLVFGGGVSAMPSMHLSMATLCFLICSKRNKWLALFTFVFMILILVGSIHLAWHYAVDSYIAIIFTAIIWYCIGKIMRHIKAFNKLT